jgi:hypothetical protein
VPPLVSAFGHRNFVSGSLQDQDVFDLGALLQRSIDNGLGRDRLSTSLALVGRDDDSAATVVGSVSEGFGGETGKDGRVNGTDSSTGKERSGRLPVMQGSARRLSVFGFHLPSHGQVDADGITLLDTPALQDIRDLADFSEQFTVRDLSGFALFVGFVDDGDLVRVGVGMSIDTVVGSVQTTFGAG